jgi:hypothetical protein
MNETVINIGIYLTYILIGAAVIGILFFSVTNIAKNPKAAKSALVGIGGLVVVFGITYALSTGADAGMYSTDEEVVTEGTSKLVGMGLSSFYVLAALTILSILYVEVTRLFK